MSYAIQNEHGGLLRRLYATGAWWTHDDAFARYETRDEAVADQRRIKAGGYLFAVDVVEVLA